MRWAVVFWSVARWIWGAIDLYGGIDGEALETPQPLSPVSSFGPAELLAARELSSDLQRLRNHLQLCSLRMLSY